MTNLFNLRAFAALLLVLVYTGTAVAAPKESFREKSSAERIREAVEKANNSRAKPGIKASEGINELEKMEESLNKDILGGLKDAEKIAARRAEIKGKEQELIKSILSQAKAKSQGAEQSLSRDLVASGLGGESVFQSAFSKDAEKLQLATNTYDDMLKEFNLIIPQGSSGREPIERALRIAAMNIAANRGPKNRQEMVNTVKKAAEALKKYKEFHAGESTGGKEKGKGDHDGEISAEGMKSDAREQATGEKFEFDADKVLASVISAVVLRDPVNGIKTLDQIPANDKAVLMGLHKMGERYEKAMKEHGSSSKAMEEVYKWLRDEVKLSKEELALLCGNGKDPAKCPAFCKPPKA